MLPRLLSRSAVVLSVVLPCASLGLGCSNSVSDARPSSGSGASASVGGNDGGGGNGGNGGNVVNDGGSGDGCPVEVPHAGDACTAQGLTCRYENSPCPIYLECDTYLVDLTWMSTGPKQGDQCSTPGQVCSYSRSIGDTCQSDLWTATCVAPDGTFDVKETLLNPCASFVCGNQTCQKGVESCQETIFDNEYQYACAPLPSACTGQTDCGCFGTLDTGCSCTQSADGDFTVSCFSI
jgi:hypothetical protein